MSFLELQQAILNTLAILAISLGLALPVGTSLSLLLMRTNIWGRPLAWIMLGSQLAIPLYVFAGGWSAGFGMQGWFTALGLSPSAWWSAAEVQGETASLWAVGLLHGLAAIPWIVLTVSCGLTYSNRSEEELAILDGGWWHAVVSVIVPKLRNWLLAAGLLCMLPVLTEMVISNLYLVSTVPEQIYLDASQGTLSPLTYVASGLVCILPIAVGLAWLRARAPAWHAVAARTNHFHAQPFDLGSARTACSCGVWIVVGALVVLPITSLIAKAGWQPYQDKLGQTAYGWSLSRLLTTGYESLTQFGENFYWSGLLALAATGCALGISIAANNLLSGRSRMVFGGLMILLVSVPGPMVGLLVEWLLNRSWPAWLGLLYDQSLAAPALAQQFRLLPLAWLMTWAIRASVSPATRQQLELDGLSRWQSLRLVLWPQTRGRWLVAALALAVLSIGELSCTILVLPPGVSTVSMRLFGLLHFGMRHQDSGLCGILIGLGWLVAAALWWILQPQSTSAAISTEGADVRHAPN